MANPRSSYPIMEISSGTLRPFLITVERAPIAISSLAAKTAVTSGACSKRVSIAILPLSYKKSP
ncbi:hypothetical protein D3C81_1908130 [compost metagenome]